MEPQCSGADASGARASSGISRVGIKASLAVAYVNLGRYAEAAEIHEQTLEAPKRTQM